MQFLKSKFLIIFLFFYLIFGSLASIKSGISFDENYEEINWKFNVKVAKNLSDHFFFNKTYDEKIQEKYIGYGIGFQIISQPTQFVLKDILSKDKNISDYGAHLLAKHFVVFLFFFISVIFFYLILKKVTNDKNFSTFGTIIYCLYPYLFGQALFSPKDVPFMSIWVICTYLSFIIFDKLLDGKKISFLNVLIFSFITSYLFSIRIAGILILLQYLISFVIFISLSKISLMSFLKEYYLKFFVFFLGLLIFTLLFYPPLWYNPSLIFEIIELMSNHFNNVGTNTFGKLMYSKNLPSTYIPIWLAVKLPLLIIIGCFLIPFTEKKIFKNAKNSIFFGTVLATVILIPLILIFRKVHLYDELRQVMFLFPLLFIIGLISLYTFSKKFFYVLGFFTVSLFLIENIKINPYQYVWFNLPSRYLDLTNKFELEYQGLSGRELANYLNESNEKNLCILANPLHVVKPFLNSKNFNCFDIWQKIDTDYKRPFLAVQNVRNLKKGIPYKCATIYESSFNLLFHKKDFITGRVLKCK